MEALRGTEDYNKITWRRGMPYHQLPSGQCGRPVAGSDKKQYLLRCVGCTPGVQHMRLISLAACKDPGVLSCQFCGFDGEPSSNGAKGSKRKPTTPEHTVGLALHGQGLLEQYAYQVRLPWWHGCMDYVHISTGTAIQIDGIGHFTGIREQSRQQVMVRDVDCCARALHNGGRLLRISNLDLDGAALYCQGAVQLAQQYTSLVILSPSYCRAGWKASNGVWRDYVGELLQHLGCKLSVVTRVTPNTYGCRGCCILVCT